MALIKSESFSLPNREALSDDRGFITRPWYLVLQAIKDAVLDIGYEKFFTLNNNISTAENIDDLLFKKENVSAATVEYLIQRVTTGTGATELVEHGTFKVVYLPTSNTWNLTMVNNNWPNNAGITFTINSTGQVKYTSTNISGTESISRMAYRTRVLSAKSNKYSKIGDYR